MLEKIVYQQYEVIRKDGYCNMLDTVCVRKFANTLGYDRLLGLIDSSNYVEILKTYSKAKEKGWV